MIHQIVAIVSTLQAEKRHKKALKNAQNPKSTDEQSMSKKDSAI